MVPLLTTTGEEQRQGFLNLRSRQQLAELLEIAEDELINIVYRTPRRRRYHQFSINKKNGGKRRISAPYSGLKDLQRRLKEVLQNVYRPKPSVYGFVTGRSIVDHAQLHLGQRYVFNIDLKDFFPTINFGRVRGMFMAVPYSLPAEIATILAQICCYDNSLPQGAPTSPIISNMICARMDSHLQRLAHRNRCFYTRYADDITFSTSLRNFPSALAVEVAPYTVIVGEQLKQIIAYNGFEIRDDKVRLRTQYQRQEVTGLTVNEFPNVRRVYIRKTRSMLYAWQKFGYEAAAQEFFMKYDSKHRAFWKDQPSFSHIIKGRINYIGMVRGREDSIYVSLREKLRELAPELVTEGNIEQTEEIMEAEAQFDVFLAYNSDDLELVQIIGEYLRDRGLQPWFDVWNVPPGRLFQEEIERVLPTINAVAVFVGSSRLGPWENLEMRAAISEFVRRRCPVIPVWLPNSDRERPLPPFLGQFTWVEFNNDAHDQEALDSLVWGITGERPE